MKQDSISIDGTRLWRSLMDLARVGATAKGGNCRLALSPLDGKGRDLVVGWMREAGLTIRVDPIGNIFGRRPGRSTSAAAVMTGSHIDTQPTGGRFDGCYGVLAGLEVMRTLNDHNIQTEAPTELAIWTNEEGSRFLPVMMGSAVFTGKYPLEKALESQDKDGLTVGSELNAIGYRGAAVCAPAEVESYIEAHIEQGPILEAEEKTVGIVTGSLGTRFYDVVVVGKEMHAGPTPMNVRRDALLGASHLVQSVVAIANNRTPHGRGTVGTIRVVPGSRNVVPGRVEFTVDLRHPDGAVLDQMATEWQAACQKVGSVHGLDVQSAEVQRYEPTPFARDLVASVELATQRRGYAATRIISGAGHDAINMAGVVPTAMIFVPCKEGISHNESEDADPAHLEAGCNVLLDVMLERAVA